MANEDFKLPNRGDIFFIIWTAFWGTVGGLTTCILNQDWPVSNFILGAIASLVGVKFLFNVDRYDWLRIMAVAIICGMSPRPILEMSKQFADNHHAISTSESVKSAALTLRSQSGNQLAAGIRGIIEPAKDVITFSPNLKSLSVRSKVESDLAIAVTEIGRVANKEPQEVIKAFAELGLTAKQSDNSSAWKQIEANLKQISKDQKQSTEVREEALQSMANISRQ